MNLQDFLIPPAESAKRSGPKDMIVMTSRIRLARNIKDSPFPGWAKKADRVKTMKTIVPAIESLPSMEGCFSESLDNLTSIDKQILVERHLISREHAAKGAGSGLVFNESESVCFMINEEDHIRMQCLLPGLQLNEVWAQINQVDSRLETALDFAFTDEWGYLTACPTNLGTGIRVSAMLHLPGLVLGEQINQIIQSGGCMGKERKPSGMFFKSRTR